MTTSLEQIIRQYIALPGTNPSGWHQVLCKVCNDHGKKGLRAGFKFEGETVAYHCFNCGHAAVYSPTNNGRISDKMITVLDAFDVPRADYGKVALLNFGKQSNDNSGVQHTRSIEPSEIPLPDTFYPLKDSSTSWADYARDYLLERSIDPDSYPFYLSEKGSSDKKSPWFKRLIIPIYKNNKLIFYTGRALVDTIIPKYLTPANAHKSRILYGFDKLFTDTNKPLYVVEGWFDAHVIDGVAIFGNTLSEEQIEWLNRSPRKKVYIPDRDNGSGYIAAKQALDQKWSLCILDKTFTDGKDISDIVTQYGKLLTIKTIVEKTFSGFTAETALGMLYNDKKRSSTKDTKPHRKERPH